ncbi:histidine kinase [Flavobacterium sp. Sd200]|uniref:sensor histidine kinase n=1 Tax=Flavobacterium sp. Sd200 TaxID=2692211 RepID=UPI00136A430E|nr:histidine kinase [Flavobacterium sp. Sd200]MXN92039.1 histidine kinase [Flavobacterium sp. Sd200]
MRLLHNFKYYLFSFFGFVLYVFFTLTLDKVSYRASFVPKEKYVGYLSYFFSEGFLCASLAWLLSIPVLYAFEHFIDFADLQKKSILKLALVFIGAQVLYSMLIWPLLNVASVQFLHDGMKLTVFMKLTNIPYFFTVFLIWLFIVTAVKLYHYFKKVKLNQVELESSLRESQLNTLKGQINPHFMFNSLNNIRGLILEDTTRARDMITRLSEMLRYSLAKSDVNTILIKEELQTVDNYIEISKIQFEDRLQFKMSADTDTLNIAIPPMIIQMLIENAVKHGISNLKNGGEINLAVYRTDGQLFIIVTNSGSLTISEGSTRLGLENIKKRLALLFGNRAHFSLMEKDTFVEAKITIPLA